MKRLILFLIICAGLLCTSAAQQRGSAKSVASCGPLAGQVFKCSRFGFTYNVPFGWVDRTEDMQQPAPDQNLQNKPAEPGVSTVERGSQPGTRTKAETSQTLLAVFERPPYAPGETINSAVVIAAEDRRDYPSVKTAAEYLGPVSDVAEQRGLKAIGEPYSFPIGSRQLVRADFSQERGKLTMWQSSLIIIERGKIVSFTFVAGSEDEVEELIGNLKFGVGGQQRQVPRR